MKKTALFAMIVCLAFLSASASTFAETLTLVSATGGNYGGEDVYPYNFTLDGTSSLQLMCLNINRQVSFGETWNVSVNGLSMDDSAASVAYRADAYIFAQMLNGSVSASDGQYAAWSIFDPNDAMANSAYTAASASLRAAALLAAVDPANIDSGFFSGFTVYQPTGDATGWTNGTPQEFIGVATAPEPSSLVLLGSGLVGVAGALRRKLTRA